MPRPVSHGDGVEAEWNPWLAELSDDEGPGQKRSGALVAAPDEAGALSRPMLRRIGLHLIANRNPKLSNGLEVPRETD